MADSIAEPCRPVRVLFMIDGLRRAGTEQWLVRLIRNLDRSQVEPHLCLKEGTTRESQSLEPDAVPILRLGIKSLGSLASIVAASRFVSYLRRHQIDVVQLHFPDSTYFGAPLAWLAGVKRVIGTSRNAGYWLTLAHRRKSRWAARFLTDVIANSNASLEAGKAIFPSSKIQWTVIPNGVDMERFRDVPPLRMVKPADDLWRVGIVANLRPVKDLPTFIRAAAEVLKTIPDVEFLIAGEGPERGNLEQLITSLQITKDVRLLGAVEDIPAFLGRLDAAVLCSLSEGCSNALIEYMAAGLPVVATETGGNLDLVTNRSNGCLVPVGDELTLASTIVNLLNDRTTARELASAAWQLVHDRLQMNKEHQSYAQFYRRLTSRLTAEGAVENRSSTASAR